MQSHHESPMPYFRTADVVHLIYISMNFFSNKLHSFAKLFCKMCSSSSVFSKLEFWSDRIRMNGSSLLFYIAYYVGMMRLFLV
jgi:hypothetical protein